MYTYINVRTYVSWCCQKDTNSIIHKKRERDEKQETQTAFNV